MPKNVKVTKRTIYDTLVRYAKQSLNGRFLELLSVSEGEAVDKDTGEHTDFIRYEVEVPRGSGEFARCRFSVKIPNGKRMISCESLENADFLISFKDLEITYIDNRKNVYFRASDCNIKKEES